MDARALPASSYSQRPGRFFVSMPRTRRSWPASSTRAMRRAWSVDVSGRAPGTTAHPTRRTATLAAHPKASALTLRSRAAILSVGSMAPSLLEIG